MFPWRLQVAVQDGGDEGAADHGGEAPAAGAERSGLGRGQSTFFITCMSFQLLLTLLSGHSHAVGVAL